MAEQTQKDWAEDGVRLRLWAEGRHTKEELGEMDFDTLHTAWKSYMLSIPGGRRMMAAMHWDFEKGEYKKGFYHNIY